MEPLNIGRGGVMSLHWVRPTLFPIFTGGTDHREQHANRHLPAHLKSLNRRGATMVRRACLVGIILLFFAIVPSITSAGEGAFTATGSLGTARHSHTATLLPNGNVLIAGGFDGTSYLTSAEVYDPTTRTPGRA